VAAPGARTSIVRLAAALLVAATGAIHLYLWFDYFHRVHVVGDLFLANAAAGGLLAAALLTLGAAGWLLARRQDKQRAASHAP